MSAQPIDFNVEAYRRESAPYREYLRTTWEMSVSLAEDSIAPCVADDLEARDSRRALVYNLSVTFFDKLALSAKDTLGQSRGGK